MALVRITQERSKIRCMVHLVRYLVRVDRVDAADPRPEGAPVARKKVTRLAGRKKTGGKAAAKRRAKSIGASRAKSAGALRAKSDSRAKSAAGRKRKKRVARS